MHELVIENLTFILEVLRYRFEMYKFLKYARDVNNTNLRFYESNYNHNNGDNKNKTPKRSERRPLCKYIDQFMYIVYKYCNHLPRNGAISMDLSTVFTWNMERLIWIAFYKENESREKNVFAKLPKDLIKHIISFANNKKDIEKIVFDRIEKNMRYVILKYICRNSYYEINIDSDCRANLVKTYKKIWQKASASSGYIGNIENENKNNEKKDNHDNMFDNIADNHGMNGYPNLNAVLREIDDDNYGKEVLVDFITCFDSAILEIIDLMESSIQRFVKTKEYSTFIKRLKKKKDSSKEKIENLNLSLNNQNAANDMQKYNVGLVIDGGHDTGDNDEQKKFYLQFIEPAREAIILNLP